MTTTATTEMGDPSTSAADPTTPTTPEPSTTMTADTTITDTETTPEPSTTMTADTTTTDTETTPEPSTIRTADTTTTDTETIWEKILFIFYLLVALFIKSRSLFSAKYWCLKCLYSVTMCF
jgi:hypothetical protein